jgi:hypothetical protein
LLMADLLAGLSFGTQSSAASGSPLDTAVLRYQDPASAAAALVKVVRPSYDHFKGQMQVVFSRARQREARTSEILSQMNLPYAFWATIYHLNRNLTPRTIDLLSVLLPLVSTITQRFKHILACPRPIEYSRMVQPMIPTPGHAAFPSAHSVEAYFVAHILARLRGGVESHPNSRLQQAFKLARRIADNRVVAGVHFPVDNAAGYVVASSLADFVHARAMGGAGPLVSRRTYEDYGLTPMSDFDPAKKLLWEHNKPVVDGPTIARSDLLNWLWLQAVEEAHAALAY